MTSALMLEAVSKQAAFADAILDKIAQARRNPGDDKSTILEGKKLIKSFQRPTPNAQRPTLNVQRPTRQF